jgi:hypothetical protein
MRFNVSTSAAALSSVNGFKIENFAASNRREEMGSETLFLNGRKQTNFPFCIIIVKGRDYQLIQFLLLNFPSFFLLIHSLSHKFSLFFFLLIAGPSMEHNKKYREHHRYRHRPTSICVLES